MSRYRLSRRFPRSRVERVTVVCVGLLIIDFFVALISFVTCAEGGCSTWHEWLDGITIYALPVLIVLALVGWLGAFVLRS
jgi:hypothetical protein